MVAPAITPTFDFLAGDGTGVAGVVVAGETGVVVPAAGVVETGLRSVSIHILLLNSWGEDAKTVFGSERDSPDVAEALPLVVAL
jgi:hypothetical protein